jgi:hypothetical protein
MICSKESDSGNGSPRRWGWGIPLKENDPQPESIMFLRESRVAVNTQNEVFLGERGAAIPLQICGRISSRFLARFCVVFQHVDSVLTLAKEDG